MDLNGRNAGAVTPKKEPQSNRSKISEISKISENSNPNVTSPGMKLLSSPLVKSAAKSQKLASKNPNLIASPSPRNKIRERRFVVAKKNSKKEKEKANSSNVACKCKDKVGGNLQKCLCVAYESLRASQEEFFKNRGGTDDLYELDTISGRAELDSGEVEEKILAIQNPEIATGSEGKPEEADCSEIEPLGQVDSSTIKRRRDKFLEEAMQSVPEPGSGRVMHLVKAFERLLSMPKSDDSDQKDENQSEENKKVMEWALPGLHPTVPETQVSSSSFCPSDFFLTSESLGLSCSLDSSQESFNNSRRSSGGGRRSRRNSSESSGTFGGRHWKRRQLKATCQRPFKLRTEPMFSGGLREW